MGAGGFVYQTDFVSETVEWLEMVFGLEEGGDRTGQSGKG